MSKKWLMIFKNCKDSAKRKDSDHGEKQYYKTRLALEELLHK